MNRILSVSALLAALTSASFGQSALAEVEVVGDGTQGATGVPQIAVNGLPVIGESAVVVRISDGAPERPAFLIASPELDASPFAGGTLFPAVERARITPVLLDGDGRATVSLTGPESIPAALGGVDVVVQAAVRDALGVSGVALTPGLRLVFGNGAHVAPAFRFPLARGTEDTVGTEVVDLDGDGRDDVVSLRAADSAVMFSRGLGHGFFADAEVLAPAQGAFGVDIALHDVGGDGILDIVTTMIDEKVIVSVMHGRGGMSFGPALATTCCEGDLINVLSSAFGDLDGDGDDDFALGVNVFTQPVFVSETIELFAAEHGQAFQHVAADLDVPATPLALAIAHLDNDGLLDIVAGASTSLAFLRTTSPFRYDVDVSTDFAGATTAFGDIDGNGLVDIVRTPLSVTAEPFLISLNRGGVFAPPIATMFSFGSAFSLRVEDVTDDGVADLSFITSEQLYSAPGIPGIAPAVPRFVVAMGTGAGGFATPRISGVTAGGDVTRIDLDGDTAIDLVVRSAGGGPGFTAVRGVGDETNIPTPGLLGRRFVNADGDPFADLVGSSGAGIRIAYGRGDGTFLDAQLVPLDDCVSVGTPDVADVNGDGLEDVLVSCERASGAWQLAILRSQPGKAPGLLDVVSIPRRARTLIADVDGNGALDLIQVSSGNTSVRVDLNDGAGGFSPGVSTAISAFTTFASVGVGDVTGDGRPDLIGGRDDVLVVYAGDGAGFRGATEVPWPYPIDATHVFDVQGVSSAYIVTRRGDGVGADVWRPDGAGGFESVSSGLITTGVRVADVDLDGNDDISNGNLVALGLPDGTFAPPQGFGWLTIADFGDVDGDGAPDVLDIGAVVLNRTFERSVTSVGAADSP